MAGAGVRNRSYPARKDLAQGVDSFSKSTPSRAFGQTSRGFAPERARLKFAVQ
jgi:hypothetical protein